MEKIKIKDDPNTLITLANFYITKEELDGFKNELEEYENKIKKIEKLSKTNSWKNSKKK